MLYAELSSISISMFKPESPLKGTLQAHILPLQQEFVFGFVFFFFCVCHRAKQEVVLRDKIKYVNTNIK